MIHNNFFITVVRTEPEVQATLPPTSAKPYFQMGNTRYEDGDTVSFDDFAEGSDALMCMTQYEDCCQSQRIGEFYYPDGSMVNIRVVRESLYRNRGVGFVRLNHVKTLTPSPPAGTYRCEILDVNGQTTSVHINIVHGSVSPVTTEEPTVPDPCSPSPCDSNAQCIAQGSTPHCRCIPPYQGSGFSCQIPGRISNTPVKAVHIKGFMLFLFCFRSMLLQSLPYQCNVYQTEPTEQCLHLYLYPTLHWRWPQL